MLFLICWGTFILFSIMAAPIWIRINSTWGFGFSFLVVFSSGLQVDSASPSRWRLKKNALGWAGCVPWTPVDVVRIILYGKGCPVVVRCTARPAVHGCLISLKPHRSSRQVTASICEWAQHHPLQQQWVGPCRDASECNRQNTKFYAVLLNFCWYW